MREIKFSYIAQHEETGLFMEQIFTMEEIEGSDFLNQWRKTFKRFGKWIARRQYTGLKDKNGKEIYEGDIIKSEQWNPNTYQVCFDRGAFYIAKKDKHEVADIKYVEDFEVIGNIYENPKLISNME